MAELTQENLKETIRETLEPFVIAIRKDIQEFRIEVNTRFDKPELRVSDLEKRVASAH
jgi:hypothetical protein